jgi:Mn-dependent DtxR family transcriptional regulator
MPSAKQVHERIKEISSKYLSGTAPLTISNLAKELQADRETVKKYIALLEAQELVVYWQDSPDMIILTDKGRKMNLE